MTWPALSISPREVFVGGLLSLAVLTALAVPPVPPRPMLMSDTRIDINLASALELRLLPRIGPVLAERIVQWRHQHGPYTSVSQLEAVSGIGPVRLSELTSLVAAPAPRR